MVNGLDSMITWNDIKVGSFIYIFSSDDRITRQQVKEIKQYNKTAFTLFILDSDPDEGSLCSVINVPQTMMINQTRELIADFDSEHLVACASESALRQVVERYLGDLQHSMDYYKDYVQGLVY